MSLRRSFPSLQPSPDVLIYCRRDGGRQRERGAVTEAAQRIRHSHQFAPGDWKSAFR